MDIPNLEKQLRFPLLSTAVKGAITLGAVAGIKGKQAYATANREEFFQSVFNDSKIFLEAQYTKFNRKSCEETPSESTIINNLICRVIEDTARNDTGDAIFLAESTLRALCSILNIYSNGKFIAMSKKKYDAEKAAAGQAVIEGVVATHAANIGVDAAVAIARANAPNSKFVKDDLTVYGPHAKKPSVAATTGTTILKGLIPASTAVASFYAGREIFTKLNRIIPKEYIPDFKELITALGNVEKESTERRVDACSDQMETMYTGDVIRTFNRSENKLALFVPILLDNCFIPFPSIPME